MRKVAEIWILIMTILSYIGCGFIALLGIVSLFDFVGFGLFLLILAAAFAFLAKTIYSKTVKQRSMGWTIAGIILSIGSILGMVGYILLLVDIVQENK